MAGAYSIMYGLRRKMAEKGQLDYTAKLIASCNCEAVCCNTYTHTHTCMFTSGPLMCIDECQGAEGAELRLKMLVDLYNSVDAAFGKMRYTVFVGLLDFCVSTDQVAKVAKHVGDVASRVQNWQLSADEQKEVSLRSQGYSRNVAYTCSTLSQ